MKQLQDRVAVITGGSSGIGLGIASRLAARGCKTVIVGRTASTLHAAANRLGALPIQGDVTELSEVQKIADEVVDRLGRVDILVNNAGIGPTAPIAAMTSNDWRWIMQANLTSVTNGIEVFLPLLAANADGGHIVNTSSIAGMFTGQGIGGYAASKFAVTALSETLAEELASSGSSVGISLFLPGPVRSNIHESSRNRPSWAANGNLMDTRLEDAAGFEDVVIPWMDPEDAGEIVVEAILSNEFYVWTHPDGSGPIIDRFSRIQRSIEKAQAKHEG